VLSSDNSSATCALTLGQDEGGHGLSVNSVAFHPTAPLLATGSGDMTAKLWQLTKDYSSVTRVVTLDGHSNVVNSVAFHPTAPILATGSGDGTVKVWKANEE
jgi:WD40 repeat protein